MAFKDLFNDNNDINEKTVVGFAYFSSKTMQLAGIETLLYQDIRPGVKFKGLIDLVFYSPNTDRWTVVDIKTSTRGWQDRAKKNPNVTAQVSSC